MADTKQQQHWRLHWKVTLLDSCAINVNLGAEHFQVSYEGIKRRKKYKVHTSQTFTIIGTGIIVPYFMFMMSTGCGWAMDPLSALISLSAALGSFPVLIHKLEVLATTGLSGWTSQLRLTCFMRLKPEKKVPGGSGITSHLAINNEL